MNSTGILSHSAMLSDYSCRFSINFENNFRFSYLYVVVHSFCLLSFVDLLQLFSCIVGACSVDSTNSSISSSACDNKSNKLSPMLDGLRMTSFGANFDTHSNLTTVVRNGKKVRAFHLHYIGL